MFSFTRRDITNLGENENMISVIHRHWFDILKNLFLTFIMIMMLIGTHVVLPAVFPILETGEYNKLLIFFESFFAMSILVFFFLIWIDYYFDVWIITSKRIINIEQRGLFSREISELELDRIQDVSADIIGIIPTFLSYGDVFIQTAGETDKFLFKNIADPYEVKDLIMSLEKNNERSIEKERAREEAREIKSAFQDQNFQ